LTTIFINEYDDDNVNIVFRASLMLHTYFYIFISAI